MKQRAETLKISTLAGCIAIQLCVGVLDLWSVFKTTAAGHYGWGDGALNMVSSFMLLCFCLGSLAGGAIQDRFSPRLSALTGIFLFGGGYLLSSLIPAGGSIILFYVTYCIMGGLGSGFVYSSVLNCLQKWLPHRRGLATGLASSAFGLSTILLSPVCGALLARMSMPQALRVLAGVLFAIGFCACLFLTQPSQAYILSRKPAAGRAAISGRELATAQAIRTIPFWCLFFSTFFFNTTWTMLSPLIKGLGVTRGLSTALGVLTVSLTGLTNAGGRLFMSILSDRLGRIATLYLLCAVTFSCALLLIVAGGPCYIAVVLLAAFAYGGPAAVNPALCTDLFGLKHAGGNYGVAMLSLGFAAVLFNAISNALYAATGTYTLTFCMGAVTAVLAALMVLVIQKHGKQPRTDAGAGQGVPMERTNP